MRKGVMRPGHVQIRVLDMDEAVVHYRDRLGLIEVNRDRQGRTYLKGWTEIDSFSVVLREADEPGMDFMGFKVLSKGVLASLQQELVDYGCQVEIIPAGELENLEVKEIMALVRERMELEIAQLEQKNFG